MTVTELSLRSFGGRRTHVPSCNSYVVAFHCRTCYVPNVESIASPAVIITTLSMIPKPIMGIDARKATIRSWSRVGYDDDDDDANLRRFGSGFGCIFRNGICENDWYQGEKMHSPRIVHAGTRQEGLWNRSMVDGEGTRRNMRGTNLMWMLSKIWLFPVHPSDPGPFLSYLPACPLLYTVLLDDDQNLTLVENDHSCHGQPPQHRSTSSFAPAVYHQKKGS